MKKIFKIYMICALAVWISSCEEEIVEKAIVSSSVEANSMNDLDADSYELLEDNQELNFDTLSWSSTDFGFAASVNYTLQMDVKGDAFANAQVLATTYDTFAVITQGDLNKALLSLGLTAGESSEVAFNVVSTIESGEVAAVISSATHVAVVPFAPSVLKPLYIIGDDQAWDLGAALQLNVLEIGEYEVYGNFGNGSYWRFFEEADWGAVQYGFSFFSTVDSDLIDGGGGDSNFIFDAASGIYKLTVSLNDKTVTVEPATEPFLYIVGDLNGWSFDPLTWNGGGKYSGTATFTNGGIFRFFTEDGNWSSQQYNFNNISTLSSNLSGTTEGDANFTFVGASGTYDFTIDIYNGEFIITE